MTSGRRRWLVLITGGAILTLTGFALIDAQRPPFRFIETYHGRKTRPTEWIEGNSDPNFVETYYEFDVDPKTVKAALYAELRGLGWKPAFKGPLWYQSPTLNEFVFLHNASEPEKKLGVTVTLRASWLARQWETVKGWFGAGTPPFRTHHGGVNIQPPPSKPKKSNAPIKGPNDA